VVDCKPDRTGGVQPFLFFDADTSNRSTNMNAYLRPLPQDPSIRISPVAMGCWPVAGMTSLHVNDADSRATLQAAVASGVNFFDTAYVYGLHGESEKLIGSELKSQRDQIVVATKCGLVWDATEKIQPDGRPATIRQQCEESLQRLGFDHVELLYLHAPDPNVPITESAGALLELQQQGKARTIGVSNCSVEQMEAFHAVCPIAAVQPPYNMLQRQIEQNILPWCQQNQVAAFVYWPLSKGLLAGKLQRDHQFEEGDGRVKLPMFQGEEWQKNQDFLEELAPVAENARCTIAQLVVQWTIQQPGVTAALCGAKRASQIEETAAAMQVKLTPADNAAIQAALKRRGVPAGRRVV